MSTSNVPESTNLTFEKVWQMFQEIARHQQEIDLIVKETSEQLKKTEIQLAETDRMIKNLYRQYSDLGERFGELAEHLVAPGVNRIFNELGFNCYEVARNIEIKDDNYRVLAEIDLLLDNDNTMIVIEMKSKPRMSDVPHHTKRLEISHEHITKHNKPGKKIIDAITGAIFDSKTKAEAISAGFYTITQSGNTLKLDVPPDFKPRNFKLFTYYFLSPPPAYLSESKHLCS
ncbi:MAG: hypothetical protein LBC74_03230 [Planctomycetaceae bacterium]|jgi:hypothetical protein|nr:hypothetical protein [Planctomycetaceae bacterium]